MEYGAGSAVAGGGGALPLLCSFASRVDRVCSDVGLNRWLEDGVLFRVREAFALRMLARCRFG